MEKDSSADDSNAVAVVVDHNHDHSDSNSNSNSNSIQQQLPNHNNSEIIEPQLEISKEDIKGIVEVSAATGKFWHDWNKLKCMLSFHLKQVLSEYPEVTMTDEEQISSIGETFQGLAKRLDDALLSFIEGPPFTLQRLCEILLAARSIYPNLSKLALALEKNLFVTSMLTISTDSYPPASEPRLTAVERENKDTGPHSNSVQNGVEHMAGDRDEVMTEVEEAEVDDDMTIDMETFEEIVRSSETNSTATGDS